MKKILILMIIALSASAYSFSEYCTNSEKTIREKVTEIIKEKNHNGDRASLMDAVSTLLGKRDAFLSFLSQKCGVSSNLTLKSQNGTDISFSAITFLDNLEQYMIYLKNNYDVKDNMLTKYLLYVSRPDSVAMRKLGKLQSGEKLNSLYIAAYDSYETFADPTSTILKMYCTNNYSSSKISGHLEPQFQEFLFLILQGNFPAADDVLNNNISSDVDNIVKTGCKDSKWVK